MTTRVGVLGWPVEHSRSPAMHNAAFEAAGLDWSYELLPVEPERFSDFVRSLPGQGFAGANVTIPHKLMALELADSASDVARAVGAANTLVFEDGRIVAHNTDAVGILEALRSCAPGAPAGARVLVLGAGGAARAAVFALGRAGSGPIDVWNRHFERAERLMADLAPALAGVDLRPVERPDLAACELLVNATSVGMERKMKRQAGTDDRPDADFKELCISADELGDRHIVVDLVYRAGGTPLVRAARERGLRCADGVEVLVRQGAESFRLWTGTMPSLEAMRHGAGD